MFTIEQEIPWSELEEQIRDTTLLGQPDARPYAESTIQLSSIPSPHFDDDTSGYLGDFRPVRATTKYVLSGNLAFQERLRQDLQSQGRDQLSLHGGLVLRDTDTNEKSVLVPPIVELAEGLGEYVLDGAHRIWIDRVRRLRNPETIKRVDHSIVYNLGDNDPTYGYTTLTRPASRLVTAIVVVYPSFPSYARPNQWSDIKVVDEVPKNLADKKGYRTDYPGGYRALYRDFSHLGSTGLRGV